MFSLYTIIGYQNNFLKKFHNIVNSIVILDEVQNIDPDYYRLLRIALDVLGKRFNIYFLLITATQPEIFNPGRSEIVDVASAPFYMEHRLFNRVRLNVLKSPQRLSDFKASFCMAFPGPNGLLVMNTKNSAIELYKHIRDNMSPDYKVFCLTTRLTPLHRKEKIQEILEALHENEKIIVVSTQLIEAGVDVSFQYVYRDFGPLDSIIQVGGRCNRNGEYGERGGVMTLLNLVDDRDAAYHLKVYKPILAQYAWDVLENQHYESGDFHTLSKNYFGKFDFVKESTKLLGAIHELNYDERMRDQTPVKDFKLIEEYNHENIHILTTPGAQEDMESLIDYREKLSNGAFSDEEKESAFFEMENLKGRLKEFQISLKKYELEAYKDSEVITEIGYFKYISLENQEQYAYDDDIGFLIEPKREIETSVFF